jgi:hypothetical protein
VAIARIYGRFETLYGRNALPSLSCGDNLASKPQTAATKQGTNLSISL